MHFGKLKRDQPGVEDAGSSHTPDGDGKHLAQRRDGCSRDGTQNTYIETIFFLVIELRTYLHKEET